MIVEVLGRQLQLRARRGEFKPRASRAGACVRALTYHALGIPESDPTPARIGMVFAHGDALEDALIDLLGRSGLALTELQRRVEIPYRYGTITGHIDALLDGHVVDFKSINTYGFEDVLQQGPLREHLVQVFMYLHGLQLAGEPARGGILLYVDKNNGRVAECTFSLDGTVGQIVALSDDGTPLPPVPFVYPEPSSLIEEGIRMFEEVEEHRIRSLARVADPTSASDAELDLPSRPYAAPVDAPCSYCSWRTRCWALQTTPAPEADGAADLSHLLPQMARYLELSEQRARIEKELEAIRAAVRVALHEAGATRGYARGVAAELITCERKVIDPTLLPPDVAAAATRAEEYTQLRIRRV